jgi:syntaxin 5
MTTSFQDRTAEFLAIAQSLPPPIPTKSSAKPEDHASDGGASSIAELRHFHTTAADISRDITAASALLQQLAGLVRSQTPATTNMSQQQQQQNELVIQIKTKMENLHSRLDEAASVIQRSKRKMGSSHSQLKQEVTNVVDTLKTDFATTASSFKSILQQRTNQLKSSPEESFHAQIYGGNAQEDDNPMPSISLSAPPPVYGGTGGGFPTLDLTSTVMMATGESTSSTPLPRPHGMDDMPNMDLVGGGAGNAGMRMRSPYLYSGAYSSFGHDQTKPLLMTPYEMQQQELDGSGRGNQQQQSQQLIPTDFDYVRQRADAMTTVESNLVELGTIFNKLAVMVNEHSELVQRVEDNVDDANTNMTLSLGVLQDTLTNLQSNRGLALRVFGILVAFILAFIIFFA